MYTNVVRMEWDHIRCSRASNLSQTRTRSSGPPDDIPQYEGATDRTRARIVNMISIEARDLANGESTIEISITTDDRDHRDLSNGREHERGGRR